MSENIGSLLDSFGLSLRAAGRTSRTVTIRVSGARRFAEWLDATGQSSDVADLGADALRAYIVALTEAGKAATTISTYAMSVKAFARWCVEEGILASDPVARVKVPRPRPPMTVIPTDDALKALLKACGGKRAIDVRDRGRHPHAARHRPATR